MNFEKFMKKYGNNLEQLNLHQSFWSRKNEETPVLGGQIEWVTGGITGGSCWGNDKMYSRSAHSEPSFDQLDNILEKICPNITFLQYKKICQDIIEEIDYEQNEYYGNSTNYRIKYFTAENLYHALLESNLL